MNILFTSAGRRVALINIFRQSMAQLGIDGVIVTADLKANAPAHQVADHGHVVPRLDNEGYIPALLDICQQHDIDYIFPCFDPDLDVISPAREQFLAIGAQPVMSSKAAMDIAYDKLKTYEFFAKHNVPTMKTVRAAELSPEDNLPFPLFFKPVAGFGSTNSQVVNNQEELDAMLRKEPTGVVQELVSGTEVTTDVLSDFDGNVISVVPRQRIEVRSGEVSKGITRRNETIIRESQRIAEALGSVGPICVQCFWDGESMNFIEINARFGGGVPLSVGAGANQVRWLLELLDGREVEPKIGQFQEDLIMLRFDEAFFVTEAELQAIEAKSKPAIPA